MSDANVISACLASTTAFELEVLQGAFMRELLRCRLWMSGFE
jgi:hypothetical protein